MWHSLDSVSSAMVQASVIGDDYTAIFVTMITNMIAGIQQR